MTEYSEVELEAYLDEELSPGKMSDVEATLRGDSELMQRLAQIIGRRDAGLHSIGAVWRRHRISCPDRGQLGSFLLGTLNQEQNDYVRFHLDTVSCRRCQANLEDLRRQQDEASDDVVTRRKKYFQSSEGYLRKGE